MDTTHRCTLEPGTPGLTGAGGVRAPGGNGSLGTLGEDLACRHLVADDRLTIVARNWRLSAGELRGELDVVAVDEALGCVVICEVKTRRDAERYGGALAAVSPRKRAKVRTLAGAFLRDAALPFHRVRLDVVAVDLGRRPTLTHLLDAL
ncbi:MAG: YraN family protein [Intrasporangiaceae bacterium]|nr:YraN family protein [Intrasporangiaceae bacterium]